MHTPEDLCHGKLITLEGLDGAGKSSILQQLPSRLTMCKVRVKPCGERQSPLSELLADSELKTMTPLLKTYLFAADRAWTYERDCLPALKAGSLVLWDRYVDSALAYRAAELRLGKNPVDMDFVEQINSPFRPPDLTLYIEISPRTSAQRTGGTTSSTPYRTDFLEMVSAEYHHLAHKRRYVVVGGERPLELVARDVAFEIKARFAELFSA